MAENVSIGVTEVVNLVSITPTPISQTVDINVTDNADDIVLNIENNVVQVNITKGLSASNVVTSVNTEVGDVVISKSTLGLSNVDNTSDVNKPISSATQTALNAKADTSYVNTQLSGKQNTLGFTPYNATNPEGYISDITQAMINEALGYTPYSTSNPSGYINSISSLMVTNALGFTPYSASNPSNYISGITSLLVTNALGYTPYNATNPSGFISGITSSNVTTALGYTPYNSTNPNGYISGINSSNVTTALGFTPENSSNKGIANGYASLDGGGLIPSTQLPSYVDDVLEYNDLASFPASGTTGKIYVALDTNKIYRWSGSAYIEVSPTVGTIWGGITGTLSNQTDLQNALNAKQASLSGTGFVKSTAGTISYDTNTYLTSVGISNLTATGTPSATTYLRGDNTWATISAGASSLSTLTDVTISSPQNGDVLKYDTATSKWINGVGGTVGNFVTIDTAQTITALKTFRGTTSSDETSLGSELATTGSGTNWSGTGFSTGYTHTPGVNTLLTTTLSAVNNSFYKVVVTITGRTAGFVQLDFGGYSNFTASSFSANFRTSSIANLSLSPTSDFNGTVVVSLKPIVSSLALRTYQNSLGINTLEYRGTANSIFFGVNAGKNISSLSSNNIVLGNNSGEAITDGVDNVIIGHSAGTLTGAANQIIAIGTFAMQSTRGGSNIAIGRSALGSGGLSGGNVAIGNFSSGQASNIFYTVAIGQSAGYSNTGTSNTIIGYDALYGKTGGDGNTVVGYQAGKYFSTGTSSNTSMSNSILLGYETRPLAVAQTNQIVIGFNVVGLGSNTTIIGNSSTTLTALYGSLITGGTSVNASAQLQVDSTTKGLLIPRMTSAQKDSIASAATGLLIYQTDGTEGTYEKISSGWRKINATGGSGTVTSVSALTLGTTGTDLSSTVANDTTTPVITLNVPTASATNRGALSSADWSTFNGKQSALSGTGFVKSNAGVISYDTNTYLTGISSSDVTTALGFTPYNATNPNNYIALTGLSSTATGLTYTNTTGVFSLTAGYVIPTTTSASNWDTAYTNRITSLTTTGSSGSATLTTNTLNIPTYTLAGLGGQASSTNLTSLSGLTFASASFVKMTSAGTFALDTNTYLTANQSITLSGVITGSGSTAITTSLASSVVGISNLSATGTPSATTYLRGDNTWATIAGGSGSPAGTTGQVQYNNAGAFGGAALVKIDADGNLNLALDTNPPIPATDTLTVFDMKVGGRNMLSIVGPAGVDNVLQTHVSRNGTTIWTAAGNSTTITAFGNAALSATGNATAANIATTNIQTRMKRVEYLVTTAATTAVAGFRASANQWWMGNTADSGGFHFICRFGPATGVTTTTSRMFVGMSSSTAAPSDVQPSSLTNFFGVGYDSADASLQFMHNANSTTTKISLNGFTVPTSDRTAMYELAMFCAPNSTTLYYTVIELSTGTSVSGTVTTNLPAANTLLSPRGWCSVGGTSSVIGIALSSLYLETDY